MSEPISISIMRERTASYNGAIYVKIPVLNAIEVLKAYDSATQRAEAAEAERDYAGVDGEFWKNMAQNMDQVRNALRAERDALRKLLRLCARTCDTLDHGPGKDFHESDEMCPIVVRIDAALAVQP